MILKLFALIFSIFAISRVILRAKDNKLTLTEFLFWTAIWSGLLVVVFLPDLTSMIAGIVGVGRGIDLIIYGCIGILFYMIFRMYIKLEETEQEITVLTREISFLKKKK